MDQFAGTPWGELTLGESFVRDLGINPAEGREIDARDRAASHLGCPGDFLSPRAAACAMEKLSCWSCPGCQATMNAGALSCGVCGWEPGDETCLRCGGCQDGRYTTRELCICTIEDLEA